MTSRRKASDPPPPPPAELQHTSFSEYEAIAEKLDGHIETLSEVAESLASEVAGLGDAISGQKSSVNALADQIERLECRLREVVEALHENTLKRTSGPVRIVHGGGQALRQITAAQAGSILAHRREAVRRRLDNQPKLDLGGNQ